jgi:PAS domain S-box-containing protein
MDRLSLRLLIILGTLVLMFYAALPWIIESLAPWLGSERPLVLSIILLVVGGLTLIVAYSSGVRSLEHHDRLHQAVEKAREDYVRLFHSSPEGIFSANENFAFTRLNISGSHIFRVTEPMDMIGKRIPSICANPTEGREFFEEIKLSPGAVQGRTIKMRSPRKNMPLWVEFTCQARRNKEGRVIGVDGIFRDVSDRVLAEDKASERFEKLQSAYLELGRVHRHMALLLDTCQLQRDENLDENEVLRSVIQSTSTLLQADAGVIFYIDDVKNRAVPVSSMDINESPLKNYVEISKSASLLEILKNPISQAIPAASSTGNLIRSVEKEGFKSAIAVPCVYRGRSIGLLELYSREGKLEIIDRELIRVLATQGAIALHDMRKKINKTAQTA